mgnify:CR=1 FL=1
MNQITKEFDTIAAISTAPGEGAISMVRLSGSQALEIADEIFVAGKKKLSQVDSHTIHYGHIYDDKREGFLDEVMVSVLKAPKTFTREDIIAHISYLLNLMDGFDVSAPTALRYSSFQAASIATTGFVSADYDRWPPFSKGILLVLMISGGCSLSLTLLSIQSNVDCHSFSSVRLYMLNSSSSTSALYQRSKLAASHVNPFAKSCSRSRLKRMHTTSLFSAALAASS